MRDNCKEEMYNEHEYKLPVVEQVFENPDEGVLVVKWKDGTYTKSRVCEGDQYDFKTGLALCFMKKATYSFDDLCNAIHTKKTTRTDEEGHLRQQLDRLEDAITESEQETNALTEKYNKLYQKLLNINSLKAAKVYRPKKNNNK